MVPMRYLTLLACAAFVSLASACGGEEEVVPGETLSLEQYLRGLETAGERADARYADDPSDGDLTSEEGQQYLRNNQSIIRDFIADLEALNPPQAVADAHTRLLDSMRQARDYIEDFLARAAAARTPEERESLNAAFLEEARAGGADEQFASACSELQRAADAEAIGVKLNCEGDADEQEAMDQLLQPAEGAPTCGASACLCEEGSCPAEIQVTLNGIPGRLTAVPPLPADLSDASVYIEFDPGSDDFFNGEIKMPLPVPAEREEKLGFYSFVVGRWEWQADVVLIYDRQVAEGKFPALPPNLAVLRESN